MSIAKKMISEIKRPCVQIDVGGLRALESLMSRTGESLREYTQLYQAGTSPDVVWDLRGCISKKMNMATLAAFLSIADRLREFSGKRQRARVHYDPNVLAFWDDTHFTSLADDFDLFEWEPKDVMGGYSRGLTNPNTRIFAFSVSGDPPPRSNEAAWIAWKDAVRDRLRDKLMLLCGRCLSRKPELTHSQKHSSI